MFGASSSLGESLILPTPGVRVLLFGEPGVDRDLCVRDLRTCGSEVQVAGLRILVQTLQRPDGWSGSAVNAAGPPHLVVVLDGRGWIPQPPPAPARRGALWVRAGRVDAARSSDVAGWDHVLPSPMSPAAWEEVLAEAGGALSFRRRSLAEPGVRDAWLRYLARVSVDAPGGASTAEVGGRPLRVLLVEDDAVVAEVTRRRLRKEGAQVTVAPGELAAMRHFRDQAWDLVLTDIRLGLDSGIRLVAEMRRLESELGREPGRILAFGEAPEGREAVDGGVSGFDGRVPKPLSDADLREALEGGGHRTGGSRGEGARGEPRVREEARRILSREVPRLVSELRAVRADDAGKGGDRLRALGHRLQGTAAVVGDPQLRTAVRTLESALAAASPGTPATPLQHAIDKLVLHLEQRPWGVGEGEPS